MKRTVLHILMALLAALLIFGSCSRGRVIPRAKMVDIYADMFMADQWIKEDYQYRRMTDTSLLYEPILESYGYTTDDYLKSVEKYMKDPERFSRILKRTAKKLEKEAASLERKMDKVRFSQTSRQEIMEWMRQVISNRILDSLVFSSFVKEPSDTSWDGVRMVIDSSWRIKDSLAIADSLAVADSLAAAESSSKVDSTAKVVFPAVKESVRKEQGKRIFPAKDSLNGKRRVLKELGSVRTNDLGTL